MLQASRFDLYVTHQLEVGGGGVGKRAGVLGWPKGFPSI